MDQSEDSCRSMVMCFRVVELHTLLKAFKCSRVGRKAELRARVFKLLKTRPNEISHQAFTSKISEIYHSMITDVKPNIAKLKQSLLQRKMNKPLQPQPQRMYSPVQHAQPIPILPAGLPLLALKVQRGVNQQINSTQSSNIRFASYPNTRNMVAQPPVNQQLGMVASDQGGFVINGVSPNINCVATSNLSLVNVKFRMSPFYEIIDELIKPTILFKQNKKPLHNTKGFEEVTFKFTLSRTNANHIFLSCNNSNKNNIFNYRAQIRIGVLEERASEIVDCIPPRAKIQVCNQMCSIPCTSNRHSEKITRRAPLSIDCTHSLNLDPTIPKTISINWIPDGKTYVIVMYLVKQLKADVLLQQLKDKKARSANRTKNYIIRKYADIDPDLVTMSHRFSLVCPLSKTRIKIPVKSVNCNHLQCYDAHSFILMNEKKPNWLCPICYRSCFYDELEIQSYFLDVISSSSLPDDCKEIELLADGSWKISIEEEKSTDGARGAKRKEEHIVNLVDSDDEGNEAISAPKKNIILDNDSKKFSSFIDLTISDDENQSVEKNNKQGNKTIAIQ